VLLPVHDGAEKATLAVVEPVTVIAPIVGASGLLGQQLEYL
jgi:hypothetical protein